MKTKILLMSILISVPLFAQNNFHGFLYKTEPDFDGFSIAHFGAGGMIYSGCRIVKIKPVISLVVTGIMAWSYEIVVDGYQNEIFKMGPDPWGADLIGDPLFTVLGGCVALIVENNLFSKRAKIWARGGRIGIEVSL